MLAAGHTVTMAWEENHGFCCSKFHVMCTWKSAEVLQLMVDNDDRHEKHSNSSALKKMKTSCVNTILLMRV